MLDFANLLKKTRETLHVRLKLNPTNCSFHINLGKFLGHIIFSHGLQTNLE